MAYQWGLCVGGDHFRQLNSRVKVQDIKGGEEDVHNAM